MYESSSYTGEKKYRKEEVKRNKSADTKTRRSVILRPNITYWDKVGIVPHAFNPPLGETEAGVSLCI